MPESFDASIYKFMKSVDSFFENALGKISSSIHPLPMEIKTFEKHDHYVIRVEGVMKEQLRFEVVDGFLKLEVEESKESIIQNDKTGFSSEERSYQRMERFIPISEGLTKKDIVTTYNDEVITFYVPKVR
ncbi:Hsp20/alpha crystallin family protein [Halobacillus mangrovi]|uniref:Hsp20/alpha crystallin family protein n=1 Tax=Halobacillus mangrovi TaxID=402384 RepID=UPI003D960DC9